MTEARGRALAILARGAIRAALGADPKSDPAEEWLQEKTATFVTITRRGKLHGCIGSIEARRSLLEDIKRNAVSAALHDPRATPIALRDVDELGIEISILSPLEPIFFQNEADALAGLRPHSDGVVFVYGGRRATFLPQVWESLPDAVEFMAHLKQKAGFPPNFWASDVRLFRYSLEKWEDPELSDRFAN